jgi:hypothetical protein
MSSFLVANHELATNIFGKLQLKDCCLRLGRGIDKSPGLGFHEDVGDGSTNKIPENNNPAYMGIRILSLRDIF